MTSITQPAGAARIVASLPVGAPLAVQYLAQVQFLLPDEPAPAGSRLMRAQLRDVARTLDVHLMPSRREAAIAFRILSRAGLLLPRVDIRETSR